MELQRSKQGIFLKDQKCALFFQSQKKSPGGGWVAVRRILLFYEKKYECDRGPHSVLMLKNLKIVSFGYGRPQNSKNHML